MNSTGKIFVWLLCFCLLFGISQVSAAPLSETYWYDDPGVGGAYTINYHLGKMGYDNNIYRGSGAYYVRSTMDQDAVLAYIGHGLPGILWCTSSNYYLSAYNVPSDPYNYSLQGKFAGATNKLKNIRFAYYGACHSDEFSSIYGRLTTYSTYNLNARSALGFSDEIYHAVATYFEERLFAWLDTAISVQAARDNAINDCYIQFGVNHVYYSNVWTANITGSTTTKLEPAAYGH